MSDRVINPKDLPDLPALEAVQVSNTRTIAILGVMIIGYWGLLLPMFIWSILYLRKYLPDSALWLVGLFVATGCWGIFRLLTADHYFRVDRTGVSVRSALRRRRIEWAEVIGAEMREGSGSEAGIRLSTVDATLIIGSGLRYTECDRLLASIWQHLRQVGKAEHVRPTPRALSFWDTIPEGCPRELHWGKCPHPARWLLPMLMLAICVPTPLMLLLDPPKGWPGYVFFGLISLLALVMLVVVTREWGKEATRVVVRDDGLEAQTSIRSVYLPWSHADFAEGSTSSQLAHDSIA